MCPFCVSTVAIVVAGAVSGGGMVALISKKLRGQREAKISTQPNSKE